MTYASSGGVRIMRICPLRTAIALLLATVPLSVSAQTGQNEKLRQVVSNLKACVRGYAATAQAAGVQTTGDAVDFFIKTCGPSLSDLAPENVGAIPPGMLRIAIRDEWAAFIEETHTR